MSARPPYLVIAFHSFLAGAVAALAVNAIWFVVTGGLPSVLVSIVAADTVVAVWSISQAARFRRRWQAVLDAYERPALGEGIDIPNRPPAEDEDGSRG
ncbi:hypothetical protein [Streptomyces adelaidensis]|uniref:hypothetical protein n=1 Tax=Streptomyces adelaidensis TaxID=2796465 RepID=UPI0019058CB6|nr:hypothetical protein [Streptomyces adelaidensis]